MTKSELVDTIKEMHYDLEDVLDAIEGCAAQARKLRDRLDDLPTVVAEIEEDEPELTEEQDK